MHGAIFQGDRDAVLSMLNRDMTDAEFRTMLGLDPEGKSGVCEGLSALMLAVEANEKEIVLTLLDHPRVDATEMLMQVNVYEGMTAPLYAASRSLVTLRLLLNHPAAAKNMATLLATHDMFGLTVLTRAAHFLDQTTGVKDFTMLLFLLRHTDPRPTPAELSALMQTLEDVLKVDDEPDVDRDECVRLLLQLGASPSRVVSRILKDVFRENERLTREVEELRRAPHLIDAVVGLAHRYPVSL